VNPGRLTSRLRRALECRFPYAAAPGAKSWYEQVRPFIGAEASAYLARRFDDEMNLPPAFVDILPWHRPNTAKESTPEVQGPNTN